MPRSTNQRLVDALVRHQVFLTGYAKSVASKVGQTLDETTPEMRKHLLDVFATNDTDRPSIRRLKQTEAKLVGLRTSGWNAAQEELIDSLAQLLQYEPEFMAESVLRVSADIHRLSNSPDAAELKQLVTGAKVIVGRNLNEVWSALRSSDLARIIGATRIGYLAREAGSRIAARVTQVASAAIPIVSNALNALETIVATAITALSSAARDLTVKANRTEFSGLELWVSVLDSVTTVGCWNLNGKIFKANEGIRPGYHYHCRSSRVPMLEDEPEPPKTEKFADWLDVQGSKFKKFVGKMTTKFERVSVKPLTLSEVQRLDKETANETE